MSMTFSNKFDPLGEKPLTLPELRLLKEDWKHHTVISALIDSAIKRRVPQQITPV